MGSNRPQRIAGAIQKKLSEILYNQLKDPRIGLVTVTNVQVSPDLRYVKVFFSVLGGEKQKKDTLIGLQRATGFVQRLIAEDLQLRFAPAIVFKFDETHEYGQRINELLEKIKRQESERHDKDSKGS